MEVFPIYLSKLDTKKTVLIGGNYEAEGKAKQLLDRNALLTVISPQLTTKLHAWAEEERFSWIRRTYRRGDLEGAFMAIVAEFEGDVNKQVYREAEELGILVNVMDDIPHANFAFGSVVKQGLLTLSVSTGGAAPALAVRLRQRFEEEFGPEYAVFLELMQKLRKPMAHYHPEFEIRKKLWYELIDSEILSMLRQGKVGEAHLKTAEIVGEPVLTEALKT